MAWKGKIRLYLTTQGNDISSKLVMQALIKDYLQSTEHSKSSLLSLTLLSNKDNPLQVFCEKFIDEALLQGLRKSNYLIDENFENLLIAYFDYYYSESLQEECIGPKIIHFRELESSLNDSLENTLDGEFSEEMVDPLQQLEAIFTQKNETLASLFILPQTAYEEAVPMLLERFKGSYEWGYKHQRIAAIILADLILPDHFVTQLFQIIVSGVSSVTIHPDCIQILLSTLQLSQMQRELLVDKIMEEVREPSSRICVFFGFFDIPAASLPKVVERLIAWREKDAQRYGVKTEVQAILSQLAVAHIQGICTNSEKWRYCFNDHPRAWFATRDLYLEHCNAIYFAFAELKTNIEQKQYEKITPSAFSFIPKGHRYTAVIPNATLKLLLPLLVHDDYFLVSRVITILTQVSFDDTPEFNPKKASPKPTELVQQALLAALKKDLGHWEALVVLKNISLSNTTEKELIPLLIKILKTVNGPVPAYHAAELLKSNRYALDNEQVRVGLFSCLEERQSHDTIRHIFSVLVKMNLWGTAWENKLKEFLTHENSHIRANSILLIGKQPYLERREFLDGVTRLLLNEHTPFVIHEICKVFAKWYREMDMDVFFQAITKHIHSHVAEEFYSALQHIVIQENDLDKKVYFIAQVESLVEQEKTAGNKINPIWDNFARTCQDKCVDAEWAAEQEKPKSTMRLADFFC